MPSRQRAIISRDVTNFEKKIFLLEMESDGTHRWKLPAGCEREVIREKELRDVATSSRGPDSKSELSIGEQR